MPRSIANEDKIEALAELFAIRNVPRNIRSDNEVEFIAASVRCELGQVGVSSSYR